MARPVFMDNSYYQRAWRMFSGGAGWVRAVVLLALAMLVPLVGVIGAMGYGLERGRRAAWGLSDEPPEGELGPGRCLRSGWRGFVVAFCWMFVPMFAFALVIALLEVAGLGPLELVLTLPMWGVELCASVMSGVAALHATVYQRIGAGFKVGRIFRMCRHGAGGLGRIVVSQLVVGLAFSFVLALVVSLVGVPLSTLVLALDPARLEDIAYLVGPASGVLTTAESLRLLGHVFVVLLPCIILWVVCWVVCMAFLYPVHYLALGLWMVQFDVAAWGDPDEPLPPFIPAQRLWTFGQDGYVRPATPAGGPAAGPAAHGGPAAPGSPAAPGEPMGLPQMTTDMPQSGYTAPVTSAGDAAPATGAGVSADGATDPNAGSARFCPACGAALVPGDKFCRACGTPVRGAGGD